ncbi:hypothetical protein QFC21_006489 [Naganishia friedmannii]|uniref:Uncharacterized protein n=1 Tax=Naganishia friedmannii TaxID=89922 RepID=A0ACC2V1R1_9TREE|nr:hypothetical protein QFC21_006489 [Naganishia friedmannii]
MADAMRVLLAGNYPDGPSRWTIPFLEAVEILEMLEKEDADERREEQPDEERARREQREREESSIQQGSAPPHMAVGKGLIQGRKWRQAQKVAKRLVAVDPLQPAPLFQLAQCYEQEQDFSETMKANLSRRDPLGTLPLKVFILIMQQGLQSDPSFGLNSSWVNQRWRNTLTQGCPELWGSLRISWEYLKDKPFKEKGAEWCQRVANKLTTLELNAMKQAGAAKILVTLSLVLKTVERLDISVVLHRALHGFVNRLMHKLTALQELEIDGGVFKPVDMGHGVRIPLDYAGPFVTAWKTQHVLMEWFWLRTRCCDRLPSFLDIPGYLSAFLLLHRTPHPLEPFAYNADFSWTCTTD